MNKKLFFFLILPFLATSQVQIGQDIDGVMADDWFGTSVAISGNGSVIAVGAPRNSGAAGHVRVFSNTSGNWVQVGNDIIGEFPQDRSGYSISLSANGTTIAIGALGNSDGGISSGHVRVYENIFGVWTQIGADIDGTTNDLSGSSVSLSADGKIVAIGSPGHFNNGTSTVVGLVRVYENISGVWTQLGTNINSTSGIYSGRSVALSAGGRVLAIGTPGGGEGRVRIYEYISGNWTQIGSDIDGEAALDRSGTSVSLSSEGNIVAIGAPSNSDGGISSGHVRIYENISGVWTQIGSDIDGDAVGDLSGTSVSLSSEGNIVAIGAPQGDGLGNSSKNGYVRVFENNSGVWTQIGVDIDGEAVGDLSGSSVSLSSDGKTVAIGAPYNDGNGNNSGHVRVYELRPPSSSSNNFISDSFEVYPNPVSDVLNIRMKNNLSLEKVTIYNNLGEIVKATQQSTIDVSTLSEGIYFVEITTNQGKAVKKVVVK